MKITKTILVFFALAIVQLPRVWALPSYTPNPGITLAPPKTPTPIVPSGKTATPSPSATPACLGEGQGNCAERECCLKNASGKPLTCVIQGGLGVCKLASTPIPMPTPTPTLACPPTEVSCGKECCPRSHKCLGPFRDGGYICEDPCANPGQYPCANLAGKPQVTPGATPAAQKCCDLDKICMLGEKGVTCESPPAGQKSCNIELQDGTKIPGVTCGGTCCITTCASPPETCCGLGEAFYPGFGCLPIGSEVCGDGTFCMPGQDCAGNGTCVPEGSKVCGGGHVCRPGYGCCGRGCCDLICCNGACCGPDQQCLNGQCAPVGYPA